MTILSINSGIHGYPATGHEYGGPITLTDFMGQIFNNSWVGTARVSLHGYAMNI
jgi:hypothetical protein